MTTLVLLVAVAACSDSDPEPSAEGASQELPALAAEPAPRLDLATLQVDTGAGTVDAVSSSWGRTYVGAASEDLYIAVALEEGVASSGPQEVVVYACDGRSAALVHGEVGRQPATLENERMAVVLSLQDDRVTGTVNIVGREPAPFAATPATGDAGLYGAAFTFEDVEYWPAWVVLADSSQRGGACWRCGDQVCCPTASDASGPVLTQDLPVVDDRSWWERLFDLF